ncbi:MAG TPA: cobalamin-independent methionine synthase II family protein [Dehalococcoidia bacterium]|nr:cobalamin-independent methionine synthase II family protein [Dehalococcoidia bacterium]
MKRSTDRMRTTHVGSLARLPEVVEPMKAKEQGRAYDDAAFRAAVRGAVESVVRRQVELGIDTVSDGEQSKSSFNNYVSERLAGFERRPGDASGAGRGAVAWSGSRERAVYPEFYEWYGRQVSEPLSATGIVTCTGPISYRGQAAVQTDIANVKAAAAAAGADEVFMPSVAVATVAASRPNEYYKTEEEYLQALADALHQEYQAIIDAELVLQIDDPRLISQYTMAPDMDVAAWRKWAQARVEVINHSLRGLPQEMVRFHTCYSIDIGPRESDLELKDIADVMLGLNVGAYSFEAANPRHEHEYHVWESTRLPEGKVLIPGVISHTTHLVEHPELIAERIVRYARIVGRENMIAGADCGFAATARAEPEIHPTVAWAKLRSLVAGAELASAQLW